MRHGFSLVELSIVLVILGLLTGGILAGQSLIRASELRSIDRQFQSYVAASQTFRDKYFALPGDMPNATRFWGRLNGNADCVTNSAAAVSSAGACDGTGDGAYLTGPSAAGESGENFQYWRHLQLAGLIEGSYTGLAGPSGLSDYLAGTNMPPGKLGNSGWRIATGGNYGGDPNSYAYDAGNEFGFGGVRANATPLAPILKPEELWNIDTKMDDGQPGFGKVIARYWGNLPSENKCTINATSQTDNVSDYNLAYSGQACAIHFARVF